MKLIFLILVSAAITPVLGQKISADKLPAAVKESFAKMFPKVTDAKWEIEKKSEYEASFKMDGKSMSANFSDKGEWKETETDINVSELPKPAVDFIHQNHKGSKIKEAAVIKKPNGVTRYEAEVDGKDVIFDENGNHVQE